MGALKLEDVLTADDCTVNSVNCPEWGGSVFLKTLSGSARDRIDATFMGHDNDPDKLDGMRATVVALSWCDENGSGEHVTRDDIETLSEKSGAALDRCYDVCVKLSGLGGAADIEGEIKNSSDA